ncbi:MAG: hypothetical protein C0609_12550 [Deltaproteobacteria bacterium]|nr:MAG: hypothetical protein C0609_12550 [Deltaproteobacteria bacterium]
MPAFAAASAVVAEVGVEIEVGDRAKARSKAIQGVLSEAVSTVVHRHVDAAVYSSRRREIARAFFANPNRYISRFVVLSEEARRGRLKLSVEAEVDDLRVQSELERMGVAFSALYANPRLCLFTMDGARSSAASERVVKRFRQEGFRVLTGSSPVDPYLIFLPSGDEGGGQSAGKLPLATKHEVVKDPDSGGSIIKFEFVEPFKGADELDGPLTVIREEARSKGSNIIVLLAADPAGVDDELSPEEAEGGSGAGAEGQEATDKDSEEKPFGFSWSFEKKKDSDKEDANAPRLKEFSLGDASFQEIMEEIEAGPTYEALVEGHIWLVDVVSGALIGEGDVGYTGEASAPDIAEAKGAEGVGERLFQEGLSLLTKSGWMPGPYKYELLINLSGINSPLLIERVEAEFAALAEFVKVSLSVVETGGATWFVEALDSGLPLAPILSSLELPGGEISWRQAGREIPSSARPEEEQAAVLEVSGVWSPR